MSLLLIIRGRSVNKLSGDLVKLLGAKFDMDYETWTSRLYPSDREYFAGPLDERGKPISPVTQRHGHVAESRFAKVLRNSPTFI